MSISQIFKQIMFGNPQQKPQSDSEKLQEAVARLKKSEKISMAYEIRQEDKRYKMDYSQHEVFTDFLYKPFKRGKEPMFFFVLRVRPMSSPVLWGEVIGECFVETGIANSRNIKKRFIYTRIQSPEDIQKTFDRYAPEYIQGRVIY